MATELYVSPTGNDTDGALGTTPFSTITAAIAALPTNGGTIVTLPGTYAEKVTLPTNPKRVRLVGDGILIPPAINTPAIEAVPGADGHEIDVTIKPHASGSTGAAVVMDGMRSCDLQVRFIVNGSATFAYGFLCDSSLGGCYLNRIRPILAGIIGPATLIKTTDGGHGYLSNPNICFIEDPFVYSCSGITTIFDLADSTGWEIRGGLLEANTGATALIPGNCTRVTGGWWELNATASIAPTTGRSLTPNNVTVEGTYFSGSQTCAIPSGVSGWRIDAKGSLTVTDSGTDNLQITGNRFAGTAINQILRLVNTGTGGKSWGLMYGRTGGAYPGSFVVWDETNGKAPVVINSNTPASTFTGSTSGAGLVGGGSWGGSVGGIAIGNATTAPTTNPSGGGVLYVEAGALKYRGSSGTVTTIGPA